MMSVLPVRLKHETRSLHEQTEVLFYTEALQNGTLTTDQYKHLLRTHFVFHRALETAIDQHSNFFRDYNPETRRKTPWLLADLTALHEPLPQADPTLLVNWSPVALLGAAYVAEGSTLGGTVIGRLLQKNPAIQSLLTQARFYQGYGPWSGHQWKSFLSFLTHQGETHADEVVVAAQQAFVDYQTVFRQI